MKDRILELRAQGKTYNEIKAELGCSKSAIAYHCGEGQKEKSNNRTQIRRKGNYIRTKMERFKYRVLSEKSRSFQRRSGSILIPREEYNFSLQEVLDKIGEYPKCYLTGRKIDLENPGSFNFDHIIPAKNGGDNSLSNLGLVDSSINRLKHTLSLEELLQLCKEILEYQGFEIRKKDE